MKVAFSKQRIASRVARLGRDITKDYRGRTLDVVVILENAFLFGADLVRHISLPVVCHFVRSEVREVQMGGYERREIFFSPQPNLAGRDVLIVDAVLHTGVTQEFLLRRLEEGRPRSLRLAVLFDKPQERKVDLQPKYTGFAAASKYWVGYGLAGRKGIFRNLPYVGLAESAARPARRGRPGRRRRRQGT